MAGNTACPAKTNASSPNDTGSVLRCTSAVVSNPGGGFAGYLRVVPYERTSGWS
jgi:hypothetical protein